MELTILGYTLAATGYTFAMTALGAAAILLFKGAPSRLFTRLSLGFAAGIMIAASVWSLLSPAMEEAEQLGWMPAIPCAGGFLLGAGFLILLDNITPHLHMSAQKPEGPATHSKCPRRRSGHAAFAQRGRQPPQGLYYGRDFRPS